MISENLENGEQRASKAADELIEEYSAMDRRIIAKYGRAVGELPCEEYTLWTNLRDREAKLSVEEQRYIWRKLRLRNTDK